MSSPFPCLSHATCLWSQHKKDVTWVIKTDNEKPTFIIAYWIFIDLWRNCLLFIIISSDVIIFTKGKEVRISNSSHPLLVNEVCCQSKTYSRDAGRKYNLWRVLDITHALSEIAWTSRMVHIHRAQLQFNSKISLVRCYWFIFFFRTAALAEILVVRFILMCSFVIIPIVAINTRTRT